MTAFIGRCAAWLVVAAMLPACADTSPLDFENSSDSGPRGHPEIPATVIAACRQCLTTGGACGSAFDDCAKDLRCQGLALCVIGDGCFSLAELQQRIDCVKPCFQESGVHSGTDSLISQALPLNVCSLPSGPCGSICVPPPQDGGSD